MAEPPETPYASVSDLLELTAFTCPTVFFKPVFTCAASTKELTIANQVCALYAIARVYPGFWTHDAEMISIALMSDPGTRSATQDGQPVKAKARFGQMVLMVELVNHLRQVRHAKDAAAVRFSSQRSHEWS